MDGAVSALQTRGWKVLPMTHLGSAEAGFAVELEARELVAHMQRQAEGVANALTKFRF